MLTMRACGTELRRSFVCSIRGSTRSSAYFSSPVHFTLASTFVKGFPTTRKRSRLPPLLPAIDRLLCGFRFLAGHASRGQLHGFEYFDITGASAKIARQSFLDLIPRRTGSVLQKRLRRQENSRCAISALSRAEFGECLL